MKKKEGLGLEDARLAVEAILTEAMKEPKRPIAVVVVDDRGDLIYGARMDGAYPLYTRLALNKAYSAAYLLTDTDDFARRQRDSNLELAAWGDHRLTDLSGGVCIIKPGTAYIPWGHKGTVLGGVGVSGRQGHEDAELARIGVRALNL